MTRAVAAGAALLLTACGVRAETAPHRLAGVAIPSVSAPVDRPAAVTVYLVRDGALAPVRRLVVAPASVTGLLAALVRGPDEREATAGLSSTLAGATPSVRTRDGVAVVDLGERFTRDVLAVGQVVLTLTQAPGVARVRFTANGVAAAVPTAAGRRTTEPVTAAGYAALVTRS